MTNLQPPGAGLPGVERFFLNRMFRLGTFLLGDRRALKRFQSETQLILETMETAEDVSEPVLIPRLTGLEDSSRNYSILMVLEHLCMVNADIIKVIGALQQGITPRGRLDIADYKPDPDVGFDVIDRFKEINREYVAIVESILQSRKKLKTKSRMAHPWFGPMDAHAWHVLAGVHQTIHRRQCRKIVALMGVV